jgi:hypothetical protein
MSDATSINSTRDRRWLILGVIGIAQLMVILDVTVMNIALPSAQRALPMQLPWSSGTRWSSSPLLATRSADDKSASLEDCG